MAFYDIDLSGDSTVLVRQEKASPQVKTAIQLFGFKGGDFYNPKIVRWPLELTVKFERLRHEQTAEQNDAGKKMRQNLMQFANKLAESKPEEAAKLREPELSRTPAMLAALSRAGLLLQQLVQLPGHLDARDNYGATALHYHTAMQLHVNMLLLLRAGANPNVAANNGATPLMLAAANEDETAMKILLRYAADANHPIATDRRVMDFIMEHCTVPTKRLVDPALHAAQLCLAMQQNKPLPLESLSEQALCSLFEGLTPPMMAIKLHRSRDYLEQLTEFGGDINMAVGGQTMMKLAVMLGDTFALQLLLRTPGIDMVSSCPPSPVEMAEMQQDKESAAIIHLAMKSQLLTDSICGHRWDNRMLMGTQNYVNAFCCGRTPLMAAAANDSLEAIKDLVTAGAKVNLQDRYGYTPLMAAAANGHPASVRLLLSLGANMFAQFRNPRTGRVATALELAKDQFSRRILQEAEDNELK